MKNHRLIVQICASNIKRFVCDTRIAAPETRPPARYRTGWRTPCFLFGLRNAIVVCYLSFHPNLETKPDAMSLFALIAALLLEQLQPLSSRKYLYGWLSAYVLFFRHHFNAGQRRHGMIAWLVAVLPLLFAVMAAYWLLERVHPVLAWAFNVLMLYLTMGFRQFSHYFTDIHLALRANRLDEARSLLSSWRGIPSHELNAEEVARVTIEQALIASHRYVFGVIVWFVLFSALGLGGAAGALLYRLGLFLSAHWNAGGGTEEGGSAEVAPELIDEGELPGTVPGEFGAFARKAFYVLEWLPVRLTAMTFAIVGNFEDTIHCWRTQASTWPDYETGILLASGAGALGVRLGMPITQGGLLEDRAELGTDLDADTDFMQSAVGLVWRAVLLWLIMLLLLSMARLIG
ncbi:MAG: cobalamin biosynthesis protein [Gallionella sp.]